MKMKLTPTSAATPSSTTSSCYPTNMEVKAPTHVHLVPHSRNDTATHFNSYFGSVADDETINMKASNYISSVQARFRHELSYSE